MNVERNRSYFIFAVFSLLIIMGSVFQILAVAAPFSVIYPADKDYEYEYNFAEKKRWSAFDAGFTGGIDTTGYFGAVYDGQYIYFAPCRTMDFHGRALRYNTKGDFYSQDSWESFDAGSTDGLDTRGYAGCVFDGRFVYYVPFAVSTTRHARVLRFDTTGEFFSSESWSAFDAQAIVGLVNSGFDGAIFDGRYIYFSPFGYDPFAHGRVLRYDTEGDFKKESSWVVYDASSTGGMDTRGYYGATYDGKYIYFVPFNDGTGFHGRVLRYDTEKDFSSSKSWSAYDAGFTGGKNTIGYKGAIYWGDYIYFVPFREAEKCHGRVLRLNISEDFNDASSWESYDAAGTDGVDTRGYVGAETDGRFIYFIPYSDENNKFHARALRYDTGEEFSDAESWNAYNAENTDELTTRGYKYGAFDGRYIYYTPYNDGTAFSGKVLRYDAHFPKVASRICVWCIY
jgi:hypothetical protein